MYYATIYCKDKTIHLWPAPTREECEQKLFDLLQDPKVFNRVDRTTIIKREFGLSNNEYIFGCPESLNIKPKVEKKLRSNS